jgi:FixH protein
MDPEIESSESARAAVSKPVMLIGVLIAAVAVIALIWLLVIREEDEPAAAGQIEQLDLAAPLFGSSGASNLLHVIVDPVREGENSLILKVTDASQDSASQTVAVESIQATIEPLAGDRDATDLPLQENGDGSYLATDPLSLSDGWWELSVTVEREGEEQRLTRFYLLAPDPNVNGFGSVPDFDSDGQAEEFYQAGIDRWAGMHTLTYIERLASGTGTVVVSQRSVTDGADGNPAGFHVTAPDYEMITIGEQTWMRQAGGDWIERTSITMYPPSDWPELYVGATEFVLGKVVDVNGRETQIVSFHVPATDQLVDAWYSWWVDVETGYVVREAMISTLHYMVYEFGEFDRPVLLEPPITGATPVASPGASPVASPPPA